MKTIQMTCRRCNATTIIDEDRVIISCPHCGAKEWIVESDNVKTAQIKYGTIKDVEHERIQLEKEKIQYKKKKEMIETIKDNLASLFAILFVVVGIAYLCIDDASHLKVPDSSGDFKGKDYKEVVYQLQDAGFKNIEPMAMGDLFDTWLYKADSKVDTIEKVSIDGKTDFREEDGFSKSAIVRIFYHTYPESEQSNKNP